MTSWPAGAGLMAAVLCSTLPTSAPKPLNRAACTSCKISAERVGRFSIDTGEITTGGNFSFMLRDGRYIIATAQSAQIWLVTPQRR